jgi:lipid-A-disaccharide synthase
VSDELSRILKDEHYRGSMLKNYDEVCRRLGEAGASARFAHMMVEDLKKDQQVRL